MGLVTSDAADVYETPDLGHLRKSWIEPKIAAEGRSYDNESTATGQENPQTSEFGMLRDQARLQGSRMMGGRVVVAVE
jgi:hypothetical protein